MYIKLKHDIDGVDDDSSDNIDNHKKKNDRVKAKAYIAKFVNAYMCTCINRVRITSANKSHLKSRNRTLGVP